MGYIIGYLIGYVIGDLLLTGILYLFFPLIYVACKGKTIEENANKLALTNTIVCLVVIVIIRLILDIFTIASFVSALICFFVAKAILIKKETEKIDITYQDEINENNDLI